MQATLSELKSGLDKLRAYMGFNALVASKIALDPGDCSIHAELAKAARNLPSRKVFLYNSYIIKLYGLVEQFIEALASDYLEEYTASYDKYSELPENLRSKHFSLSAELMQSLNHSRFSKVRPTEIVSSLNACLNNDSPSLNYDAFKIHPYNFRHDTICEFLGRIGIKSLTTSLKVNPSFAKFLANEFGDTSQLPSEALFFKINDLAERRNDIAHGVEEIELLSPPLVNGYIDFIWNYCQGIFEAALEKLAEAKFDVFQKSLDPIDVIDNRILLTRIDNTHLRIGDSIIVKRSASYPHFQEGRIIGIQKDRVSYREMNLSSPENIGIEINVRIKSTNQFKIRNAP